jgi:hypothetical protein
VISRFIKKSTRLLGTGCETAADVNELSTMEKAKGGINESAGQR